MERTRYPSSSQVPNANGVGHPIPWTISNTRSCMYSEPRTSQAIPTSSHTSQMYRQDQQGSTNYYQTLSAAPPHMTTSVQQTSGVSNRQFIAQQAGMGGHMEHPNSPGLLPNGMANSNWKGQEQVLKQEPMSPTATTTCQQPSPQSNQDCMSAASIAAGSGRGGRKGNGKMNTQAPVLNDNPWVQITEQPKSRGLRFRYECEGRSAGSIPGERSQIERKSYPSIKIHNYQGTAVVVVSCVTKDNPPKPHPHSLVGKGCDKGVYTQKIKSHEMVASFPHLGIQCAKRKDVEDALKQREQIRVDPFTTGFKHKANQIDLNVVRLCFQVFLPDSSGRFTRIVAPCVSNPIYDKKAAGDLVICRLDKHAGSVRGGEEVFLLCEKVNKDDIKVRFFEDDEEGMTVWEHYGEFGASDVHRQFAIVFKTPPYHKKDITRPVTVMLQLVRPSDDETSEPKQFIYKPEDHDPEYILAKKKRKLADPLCDPVHMASIPSTVPVDAADSEMMDVGNPSVKERVKLKASRNIQTKKEDEASPATAVSQYPLYDLAGTTDGALQMTYTSGGYQIQAPPSGGGGDMYYSYPAGDVQAAEAMTFQATEGMSHQQILETLSAGGVEPVNSSDSAELRRFVLENFPAMQGVDNEGNISLPNSLLTSLEPLDVAANVSVGEEQSPQLHTLQTVSVSTQQKS